MNKKILFPIFILLGFLLAVYAASIGDSLEIVFVSGNTTINATDICFTDGTCVSDVTGNLTDTNADTICSGTNVYLDGEGNCDTIESSTPHTNRTDAEIINLAWGQGFYYHQENITDIIDSKRPGTNRTDADILSVMDANRPHTNLTESDIHGFGFITNVINYTIGNCSGKNCDIGWGNLTGVPVGFADGIDDTGSGADYTVIQNITGGYNCTGGEIAVGRYPNGTWKCTTDQTGGGDMSELDIVNTTILWNTGFYYSALNITTIIDANRPGTNRTDAEIINLAWGQGFYYHQENLTDIIDSKRPGTNRTDADILSVMDANRPHTNLTESDVESFIFDNDNSANFNMTVYNITFQSCTIRTNSTPCLIQECGSSSFAICP